MLGSITHEVDPQGARDDRPSTAAEAVDPSGARMVRFALWSREERSGDMKPNVAMSVEYPKRPAGVG